MGPSPIAVKTNDHERELVKMAQRGDSQAFNELLTAFEPHMRGSIRTRARERDVEEILQEARIRIWHKLDRYNPERGPIVAFLRQYAIWSTLDFYRRQQAHDLVEILVAEIRARYPDWEDDAEMLEYLGATSPPNQGEDPEKEKWDLEILDHEAILNKLLEISLSIDGPPHELITFGYCKLLDWKPGRLVAQSSNSPLDGMTAGLESEFAAASKLDEALVRSAFEPLRNQMPQTLRALLTNRDTQLRYRTLLDRQVGGTVLADYFAGSPTADVSHWWWAVRRRVLQRAAAEQGKPFSELVERFIERPAARKRPSKRKE